MATAAKVYKKLIWQDPERVSGTPCFYGTLVPVENLFDNLKAGETVESFAAIYHLPLKQVIGVLRLSRKSLLRPFDAA